MNFSYGAGPDFRSAPFSHGCLPERGIPEKIILNFIYIVIFITYIVKIITYNKDMKEMIILQQNKEAKHQGSSRPNASSKKYETRKRSGSICSTIG
jgi:hypothetical protein